jgi:hypothetical protein
VSVIPSPFIKIYERGRDNTHTSLLRLMLVHMLMFVRKDSLDEVWLVCTVKSKRPNRDAVLRNREVPVDFPLKNGAGRPINPLNVVTGPPARRVK